MTIFNVVVSTPDFESGDLGSNPGRTFFLFSLALQPFKFYCPGRLADKSWPKVLLTDLW